MSRAVIPVLRQVYTIYSILSLVFIILIIVTAFITIALTYFQLAVEDHAWWWRSFLCGGATGACLAASPPLSLPEMRTFQHMLSCAHPTLVQSRSNIRVVYTFRIITNSGESCTGHCAALAETNLLGHLSDI